MQTRPILLPGDFVEIIAPASRCSDSELAALKNLLLSWQLHCIVADDIFGNDLFCANTDKQRLKHLTHALTHPNTKAIICARGGYGSLRLIPELANITPPATAKLFVGMSDITALQLYLQQHWRWPTIHGAASPTRFSLESIERLKAILFGTTHQMIFDSLTPLNQAAKQQQTIEAEIIGGNLTLIQTSIGTHWQLDSKNKIILLEEIGERGYRIDRMLEHLRQATIFQQAKAILLGDFLEGKEPDGSSLIAATLKRFAESCSIPVVQLAGIGHGYTHFPIPLGAKSTLHLQGKITLNVTY